MSHNKIIQMSANHIEAKTRWLIFCIFKFISLNKNIFISIEISLKLVPYTPIDNKPALVQIIVWRRPGDKPWSESMMAYLTDAYMHHSASMS